VEADASRPVDGLPHEGCRQPGVDGGDPLGLDHVAQEGGEAGLLSVGGHGTHQLDTYLLCYFGGWGQVGISLSYLSSGIRQQQRGERIVTDAPPLFTQLQNQYGSRVGREEDGGAEKMKRRN